MDAGIHNFQGNNTMLNNSPSIISARFLVQHPVLKPYREAEPTARDWANDLGYHCEHTRARCKERYQLDLSQNDWEKLNWAVFRECKPYVIFDYVRTYNTTV